MMYWELFRTFFIIGLFSFGGGYAVIPTMEVEAIQNGWMTSEQFTEIIVQASVFPGPIVSNSAVFIGYHIGGIMGALVSGVAIILPSLLLIIILSLCFKGKGQNPFIVSAFYGIRPVVFGLITYAAIRFGISIQLFSLSAIPEISQWIIFLISLYLLIKYDINPLYVIILSGFVGIVLYS